MSTNAEQFQIKQKSVPVCKRLELSELLKGHLKKGTTKTLEWFKGKKEAEFIKMAQSKPRSQSD